MDRSLIAVVILMTIILAPMVAVGLTELWGRLHDDYYQ